MFRHFLASPKYGLLHTLDMPTPCEEHLRRRLGTLSVSLAYASLLLCYWSDHARHLSNTMLKPGSLILCGRSSPSFQGRRNCADDLSGLVHGDGVTAAQTAARLCPRN